MIGRALPALLTALLIAGCGGTKDKPATSSEKASSTPAAATPTGTKKTSATHHDIAGAGVGTTQYAAVEKLAEKGFPVYCGGRHGDMVALTFDDGPGPYTHYVIKRLRRNNMRATFFLNTKNLGTFKPVIKTELPYGTIGNHTANHLYLPGLTTDQMHQEIDNAQVELGKDAGFPIELFRAPYGATNAAIEQHVQQRRMLQILWTVDSGDSLGNNYAQIRSVVTGALKPGNIILMHDNRGQTVRALPDILHAVRHAHLKAVTVPELMAADPPSEAQLKAGPKGC